MSAHTRAGRTRAGRLPALASPTLTFPRAGRLHWLAVHLNRDRILTAAVELLDSYGLGDVTMRRVATSLSVAPGALYWHFPNKQSLLAALAHHIVSPVLADAAQAQDPVRLSLELRAALRAHRDGAEVVAAAVSQPDSPTWNDAIAAYTAAIAHELPSIPTELAQVGAATLAHFVLGAVSAEQSREQLVALTADAASSNSSSADSRDPARAIAQGTEIVMAGLRHNLS